MRITDDPYWSGLSRSDVQDAYAAAGLLAARGVPDEGALVDALARGSHDVGSWGPVSTSGFRLPYTPCSAPRRLPWSTPGIRPFLR